MSFGAVATIGGSIIGGLISADAQGDAAESAADAQTQASAASIAEQRRQFDAIVALLKPYVDAGGPALSAQQDILGLNGGTAQQGAYDAIENSPAFGALQQTGEEAILQNASATGGLRGGNVQAALAQFRPQLLAKLIESQYAKLGGITSIGQNAAALQGNAGQVAGTNIGALLGDAGAAQAGGFLAQGRATSNLVGGITEGIGRFAGDGGFERLFNRFNSSGGSDGGLTFGDDSDF